MKKIMFLVAVLSVMASGTVLANERGPKRGPKGKIDVCDIHHHKPGCEFFVSHHGTPPPPPHAVKGCCKCSDKGCWHKRGDKRGGKRGGKRGDRFGSKPAVPCHGFNTPPAGAPPTPSRR